MPTRELNKRLRDVIRTRYGNSVRAASKALGMNANSLQVIVDNPNSEPKLDTLWSMAETFDWPFMNVVYWTMGREPSAPTEPAKVLAECLVTIGVTEDMRSAIVQVVMQGLPAATNSR